MNKNLTPFEQGRSFASQFTARRMNDIQRAIPRIRFSGGGARVSYIGDQVFVDFPRARPSAQATATSWPFKGYNVTNPTDGGAMQFNGGDGSLASLNGVVANVNGQRTDTKTGSPLAYPKLSVTGNGVVYVYASSLTGTDSGVPTPGSVDIYYGGTVPPADTATPITYAASLLGTVSNYAVDGEGNPSFTYNDAVGPVGVTGIYVCGNVAQIA